MDGLFARSALSVAPLLWRRISGGGGGGGGATTYATSVIVRGFATEPPPTPSPFRMRRDPYEHMQKMHPPLYAPPPENRVKPPKQAWGNRRPKARKRFKIHQDARVAHEVLSNARSPSIVLHYATTLLKRVPHSRTGELPPYHDPEAVARSSEGAPPFPLGAMNPHLATLALQRVARTATTFPGEDHVQTKKQREQALRSTLNDERYWLLCNALIQGREYLDDMHINRILWSLQRLLPGYATVFGADDAPGAVTVLSAPPNHERHFKKEVMQDVDEGDIVEEKHESDHELGQSEKNGDEDGEDKESKTDKKISALVSAPIMKHEASYTLLLNSLHELKDRLEDDSVSALALCGSVWALGGLGLGPTWLAGEEVRQYVGMAVNSTPWQRWVADLPSGSAAVNALVGLAKLGGPPPSPRSSQIVDSLPEQDEPDFKHDRLVGAVTAAVDVATANARDRQANGAALVAALARAVSTDIQEVNDQGLANVLWAYSMLWRKNGAGCGFTSNLMAGGLNAVEQREGAGENEASTNGSYDLDAASNEVSRRCADPTRVPNLSSLSRILFAWSRLYRSRGYEPPAEAFMEVCKAVERVLKARYERIRAVAADAKDDSILGSRQICSHQDLMSLLVALSHLPHGMDQGLYALAWSIAGIQFPDATLSYQHAEKIRQSPLPAPRVVKNMLERTGKRINGKRIPKRASEDDKRAMRIPENLRNVPRLSRKEVAQLEALLGQRETTRQLHPRLVRRLQQTTAAASAMEAKKSDK
ncbi:hypothetical protein RI054_12g60850 [Pseudoscourfieldia marina]